MAKMRVFEVPGPGAMPDKELPVVEVQGRGDKAKVAARKLLETEGFQVRALNWGPDPGQPDPQLVAYVTRNRGT